MRRFDINDRIIIVKNDRNSGKEGRIIDVRDLTHYPVTIYRVAFSDGSKRDYFWADIQHI